MIFYQNKHNGLTRLLLENDSIRVTVFPELGGKISSIYNKELQREFLWKNPSLRYSVCAPGSNYELNFSGGIDELLPNDIPEEIMGDSYPDHGELWTTKLSYTLSNGKLSCYGVLPLSELRYEKEMWLESNQSELYIRYSVRNESDSLNYFMWKLHAAINIEATSKINSNAKLAKSVYGVTKNDGYGEEFDWPIVEGRDASIIPFKNNTLDFFYLYNISEGNMSVKNIKQGYNFEISYDSDVFPYQWYFGSYGGFRGHYVGILEPSTSMPVSVNEAINLNQCSSLKNGEEINTVVKVYAGRI